MKEYKLALSCSSLFIYLSKMDIYNGRFLAIKAEVERAKQHHTDKNMNDDDDEDNPNDLGEIDEPEWIESVGPNAQYENFSKRCCRP
jgi:hypothetical protein